MRLPLRIVAGAGIFLLLSACNYIPGLGAPATSTPTAALSETETVPSPSTNRQSLSANITDVVMARGRNAVTGEPEGMTDVFLPESPAIYAMFKASGPAGTTFESRWTLVDSRNTGDEETFSFWLTLPVDLYPPEWSHFVLTQEGFRWPVGEYEVALLIDDQEVVYLPFMIR